MVEAVVSDPHLERDEENASSDGSETEPFLLPRRHSKHKSESEFSLSSSRCALVYGGFLATLCLYVDRVGFALAYTAEAKLLGLSESTKGLALSSFFWGYAIAQVPGVFLAVRIGGERTLCSAFVVWGIISLLVPWVCWSVHLVSVARICMGLAQGLVIPSLHTLLSEHVLAHEVSRAVFVATSGMYMGSALAMGILPVLIDWAGPSSATASSGFCAIVWLAVWHLVLSKPTKEPEKASETLAMQLRLGDYGTQPHSTGVAPWRQLLSSPAVLAIVTNSFAFHLVFYTFINWLPTFFDELVKVPLRSMGRTRLLPYLLMFCSSLFGGFLGDSLVTHGMAVANTRKLINSVGFGVTVVALSCLMGIYEGLVRTAMSAVCVGFVALGFARGGFSINHLDIAPRQAGIVIALSNSAATVAGILGVSLTGFALDFAGGADVRTGWQYSFGWTGFVVLACALFFVFYASDERIFH
mmetsp:Transcript_6495/g.18191  ORF Transcript_6495/g.18191 Transcript_6495/m.18191 type:complete len:470 (-) Transcript_6495:210-1619(-)|eukprot:CAMPEP_0194523048 /NCGR_PEP_ID=MMETSP0253-20130528/57818_1 /TAXON_ID=2966 /ORGANISM="Noctiluca scintillans" /LENGTH=469 /DNA_ID=CAMNT_0039367547 /DNA_START=81 /DNA_END=1490 /DNA_ORIENTATION=+